MSAEVPRKVVAVVPDLFFAAKIGETARQVGAEIDFVPSAADLLLRAQSKPALIVMDLNAEGLDAIATIEQLKADGASASLPLVGFVRHEMSELINSAREAGCERVLSRNAFSKHLPQILSGESYQEDGSAKKC